MRANSLNEDRPIDEHLVLRDEVVDGPLDGVLRGPEGVVAAIPHLLGFYPQDSLVILWMAHRRIRLTQRMDLEAIEDDLGSLADSIEGVAATCGADAAVIIIYGADDAPDRGWWPDACDAVGLALDRTEVRLVDALHVHCGRWWSYLCEASCCPPEGRTVSQAVRDEVADLLGESGSPAASRDAVVAELEADADLVARVAERVKAWQVSRDERLAAAASADAERERWRDEQVQALLPAFSGGQASGHQDGARMGGEPGPDEFARVLVALADIRVRDTLLWHLSAAGQAAACMAHLLPALRGAPAGDVAPLATCIAICAWMKGDGVRANAALDRALADDGAYSLAWLVGQAISHGLPPSSWQQMMAMLSEGECRTGIPLASQAGESPTSHA